MAKKAAKGAGARGGPGKKISVKKIVAEIDKTLKALEKRTEAVSTTRVGPQASHNTARARLSLRAARDAVASACVPGFEIPND
jgi:hypothetical protein